MGDFRKGGNRNKFGGRPSFGNRPSFGGRPNFNRGGEDRPMFRTTCSDCGKSCEVPFRPTGEKPVFCNDCFARNKGGAPSGDFRPRENFREAQMKPVEDKRIDDIKRQIAELGLKLDSILDKMNLGKISEVADKKEAASKPAKAKAKPKAKGKKK